MELRRIAACIKDLKEIIRIHEGLLDGSIKPHTDELKGITIPIERSMNYLNIEFMVTLNTDLDPYEYAASHGSPSDGQATESGSDKADPF